MGCIPVPLIVECRLAEVVHWTKPAPSRTLAGHVNTQSDLSIAASRYATKQAPEYVVTGQLQTACQFHPQTQHSDLVTLNCPARVVRTEYPRRFPVGALLAVYLLCSALAHELRLEFRVCETVDGEREHRCPTFLQPSHIELEALDANGE